MTVAPVNATWRRLVAAQLQMRSADLAAVSQTTRFLESEPRVIARQRRVVLGLGLLAPLLLVLLGVLAAALAATNDIANIRSARELAERLALRGPDGRLREGPFAVDVFDTPSGIASPVRRALPGFVGGGRTAGGAREFVIPNLGRSELQNRVQYQVQ